jgi:16S rRNA U1498 N3-methylase RsmE
VFVGSATALAAASVGSVLRLDGPEGRHAVSVRRMGPGESIDLVDGLGRRVSGSVRAVIDKQARRARFPVVESLASTADVVARLADAATALVLHEEARVPIAAVTIPADGDLLLVVGPEGGLTPGECEAFAAAGATGVRLGPSVLRTSSSGIAAVSALLARSPRWAVPRAAGDGRMTP